jgi:DNA-directed RNA polymerase specialized sigma24 family protein
MHPSTSFPKFPDTRWTLIARLCGPESEARKAIGELCELYWRPLYCFARQRGFPPEDAKDVTQDFLMSALRRNLFGRAERERGRLRTLLLHAFNQFFLTKAERDGAEFRGGKVQHVSMDAPTVQEQYLAEYIEGETPERSFHRSWAHTLLDRVLLRLEENWRVAGKTEWFETLKPFLSGGRDGEESYEAAGRRLNATAGSVRLAAFRLRRNYRDELLREIRETVASDDPAELDDELNFLFHSLA